MGVLDPLPQLKTLDAGMEALPDGIGCCCAPIAQRKLSWPFGAQQRRTPAVTDSIPASKVLTTGEPLRAPEGAPAGTFGRPRAPLDRLRAYRAGIADAGAEVGQEDRGR